MPEVRESCPHGTGEIAAGDKETQIFERMRRFSMQDFERRLQALDVRYRPSMRESFYHDRLSGS